MAGILIVEDETDLREMLVEALSTADYVVRQAGTIAEAQERLQQFKPDLILLDWMLPDISGLQWLRGLRRDQQYRDIPVIMLTAKDAVEDRVQGLDSGADDYLVKPFSLKELKARIRTCLRRVDDDSQSRILSAEDLVLDVQAHRVSTDQGEIKLGPTEFNLLQHFMAHPNRVYSRSQLLDAVWGQNTFIEERTVDVHIRRLRKALEAYGKASLVQTIRGAGYRFSMEVSA